MTKRLTGAGFLLCALLLTACEPGTESTGGAEPPTPSTPTSQPQTVMDKRACEKALQGKVARTPGGSREWPAEDIADLCLEQETSTEPARCFDGLMNGDVRWRDTDEWRFDDVIELCRNAHKASSVISCVQAADRSGKSLARSIQGCGRS